MNETCRASDANPATMSRGGLTFGIFVGGVLDYPGELSSGKLDSADEVIGALDKLQNGKSLLIRRYLRFTGSTEALNEPLPALDLGRYLSKSRKLDLVLSNWDSSGDMSRWWEFIDLAIRGYGALTSKIQICEEPNRFDYPGDGRFPHSVQAVATGLRAARQSLMRYGLNCKLGFNAVPEDLFNHGFWHNLGNQLDQAAIWDEIDYIGLNIYIDVEQPVVGSVEDALEKEIANFRNVSLAKARVPTSIPLHITENGWPTGPNRFYTRQSEILESVVRKVYALREVLHITHFELFSLRDSDTADPNLAKQFGIMRDDYTPKPAFESYRKLIAELGE